MAVSAATIATAVATAASSRGIDFRVIVPSRPLRVDDRERVPAEGKIGTGLTEPLQRPLGWLTGAAGRQGLSRRRPARLLLLLRRPRMRFRRRPDRFAARTARKGEPRDRRLPADRRQPPVAHARGKRLL